MLMERRDRGGGGAKAHWEGEKQNGDCITSWGENARVLGEAGDLHDPYS